MARWVREPEEADSREAGSNRVFIACSLDGFIAGPNDELDWLSGWEGAADTFTPFFAKVGAMLMGRRTYDVVCGFQQAWPYGDTPVLVATSRELVPIRPSVQAVQGSIEEMMAAAERAAGKRYVYVDGGRLIRSALEAGLIGHITVTFIPMILGKGVPLFAGIEKPQRLELLAQRSIGGGLLEVQYRPKRPHRV